MDLSVIIKKVFRQLMELECTESISRINDLCNRTNQGKIKLEDYNNEIEKIVNKVTDVPTMFMTEHWDWAQSSIAYILSKIKTNGKAPIHLNITHKEFVFLRNTLKERKGYELDKLSA